MSKQIKQQFVFSIICLIFLFANVSCDTEKPNKENGQIPKQDFIQLQNDKFTLNDSAFYPIMLNYKIEMRNINDTVVVSPAIYYENNNVFETNTPAEIQTQMCGHFQLIKELGFNTIRICADVIYKNDSSYYFKSNDKITYLIKDSTKIYSAFDNMLSIAKENDLKVMLLIKFPLEPEIKEYTIGLLKHLKDNPTLFAYDFMNEPLYFDPQETRDKKDAFSIVHEWRNMVRDYAPYQLFTIGFSEPIEVFEWDPAVLPVDFIQIHTYHPLRVPNEIWWYSNYTNKPFMIGETSLPADNDSVDYNLQRNFIHEVYQYALNCNSIGFGWWEFQDLPGTHFEAEYSGLLNHEGTTKTKDGKYTIIGTLKPVAYEIAKLKKLKPQTPKQAVNYYNMVGYNNIVIRGKIVDKQTGNPIEGAVIRGWNKWWSVGLNTFTNENGEFTLYSNDFCEHFEISAPNKTKIKFDKELQYNQLDESYSADNLPNQMLEYQKISYFPFLQNDSVLLEFKPELFDKAKFESDMGTLYLEDLK